MDFFESEDGVRIAYRVEGEGSPVLLAHGFASTHEVNWVATGWTKALTGAGYRVILPDMRGHGASGKPHDTHAYTLSAMAADLTGLLDHLGEPGADLMGYSMGAMVSLVAAMETPERFDKIVAAGVGAKLLDPKRDPGPVIEALLTDDPSGIEDKGALLFRTFADQNKQDREALAACFEAVRAPLVYRDETRRLVQRFKAEAHLPSAQLLVALFLEASPAGEKEGVPDALIGVPRHPARAKRFGFDQGQWLADELGRRLGVPVRRAWRRRDDRPQHELGSRARRRIASGMFGIASGLPRHVALVDDVMTTGATLERLAQACRRAGARRVDAWALARTPPPWLC